jgi:hypothetical protein
LLQCGNVAARSVTLGPCAQSPSKFARQNDNGDANKKNDQTRFAMEIRPIIGIRNSEYEFIVNPIVDIGFGKYGEQHCF